MSVVVVDMGADAMDGSTVPHFPATLGRGDPDAAWCGFWEGGRRVGVCRSSGFMGLGGLSVKPETRLCCPKRTKRILAERGQRDSSECPAQKCCGLKN